jgi:hypothetical protein
MGSAVTTSVLTSGEIKELLEEAAEARLLAAEMNDPASIHDLIAYATALEDNAASLSGAAVDGNDWQYRVSTELFRAMGEPTRNGLPAGRAG